MNLENIPTIKCHTQLNVSDVVKEVGMVKLQARAQGQKARSGGGIRVGFEGGQMPIPKASRRGFNNKNFKISYQLVNVGHLDKLRATL